MIRFGSMISTVIELVVTYFIGVRNDLNFTAKTKVVTYKRKRSNIFILKV